MCYFKGHPQHRGVSQNQTYAFLLTAPRSYILRHLTVVILTSYGKSPSIEVETPPFSHIIEDQTPHLFRGNHLIDLK